jgi:RHS repeat-associated protein
MQGAGGVGGLLAVNTATNGTHFATFDGNGNVVGLVNASNGSTSAQFEYGPFAEFIGAFGLMADMPLTFSTKYYDAETGCYYYGYRYYKDGRWLSKDPLGEDGGINLYNYVGNNPVNEIDPLGLTWSSNWNFFWDWALGRGPRNRNYGPNSTETQEMQNSPGGNALRDAFYKNSCKNVDKFGYSTPQAALDTLPYPSPTGAQVGGFGRATAVDNGNGTVTFTIPNVAGTHSFFYHIVPDRSSPTGPGSNIRQTFQWTEPIDKSKCRCSPK